MRLSILVALTLLLFSHAEIVSVTTEIHGAGVLRFHFDNTSSLTPCRNVMILGVGTAMSVSDYDLISHQMVDSNTIPIFVDPEPDWFIKTSAGRFAKLTNVLVKQLHNVVPVCSSQPNLILVGGHSAGGQAALEALELYKFSVSGYFGLDPFEITQEQKNNNDLPSLFWGFEKTTCGVDVNRAARAAYGISNPNHRALYLIQNMDKHVHHCVFTNHGCCACPDTMSLDKQEEILALVGESSRRLVQALENNMFTKSKFELDNDMIRSFVNQDGVNETTSVSQLD